MFLELQLIVTILHISSSSSSFHCQNGATYDVVYDRCECSPSYFGYRCETAFASDDPCKKESELPVIEDLEGNYRPGAAASLSKAKTTSKSQTTSFLFSGITPQWYRVLSPWGNRLVEGCGSGVKDSDCGGRAAYVLHDVAAEEEKPNHRALFKARAFRVWSQLESCRIIEDTFYPVRILKCSQSLTLYFLLPLPRTHSYCIGDESDPSAQGLAEILFPKKPALKLIYESGSYNGHYYGKFLCSVFGSPFKNYTYAIRFVLTGPDGRKRIIDSCNKSKQIIPPSCTGNCTFVCPWFNIAEQNLSIYGSNLVCSVQPENLNVPEISSEVHSFTFPWNFTNNFDTIRPGKPVELCISTWNIPTTEKITFSVSVARKIVYKRDRVDVAILSNNSNNSQDACQIPTTASSSRKLRKICMKLVLYNEDHEGHLIFGRESAEQLSEVKVNISYKTSADGIATFRSSSSKELIFKQMESIRLKVDLRSSISGPQGYLHIFSDPFVKPVGGIYNENSIYELKANRGKSDVYIAMRHRLLPYEVQVLISRPQSAVQDNAGSSVVTQVAVRYDHIIINISGSQSKNNAALQVHKSCKAANSPISRVHAASRCDVRRNGIEIESTSDVVRIRFLFYGTIVYVWKFRTHLEANSSCAHRFIMSQRDMKNTACRGSIHRIGDGKEFALDLTVIPSMFDYQGNVEGLMYARSSSEAKMYNVSDPTKNLFSDKYKITMPQKDNESLIYQPFEVMKICKCDQSGKASSKSNNCHVDLTDVKRTKREIPATVAIPEENDRPKDTNPQRVRESSSAQREISPKEAQQFCSEFLSVQMIERNYSLLVCSGHSDHPIGVDYATQFEFLCVQYALTQRTYQFAETLLNSMLDACQKAISYNASEARSDSGLLKDLEWEICPNNCSANGVCLAGACACKSGFSGRGCENRSKELETFPTRISMANTNFVCTSGNCSSTLLLVTPLLKSRVADCLIRQVDALTVETESRGSRGSWKIPAVYTAGSVMMCNVSEIHNWLKAENRLYAAIEIRLTAETWHSNNSVTRLLVQSECSGWKTECRIVTEKDMMTNALLAHNANGWICFNNGSATPADAAVANNNRCRQVSDVIKNSSPMLFVLLLPAFVLVIFLTVSIQIYVCRRELSASDFLNSISKKVGQNLHRIAKKLAVSSVARRATTAAGRTSVRNDWTAMEQAEEMLL